MLDAAQAKSWPPSVRFVHARIEELAEHGITGPFDGILAAYLLRNLADPDSQLRTFRTLLRPGGTLAVHEYSVRDSRGATRIWHAVCWGIIIPAGWWRTRNTTLYRHLWRSVLTFDGAARLRQRMSDAGFTAVGSETMPGWEHNIVHTFVGKAPRSPTASPNPSGIARITRCQRAIVAAARCGRRRRHCRAGSRDGARRMGHRRRGRREGALPRRSGRRLDRTSRRHRLRDKPGFHAFFRQYYNLRALLRCVDPQLRMLTPVEDYPLIDGAGRRDTFRGLPHTPPWNALAFALRSPTFRLSDLVRIDARAAAPLAAVSLPDIYHQLDHIDAETFLKSINFPESARHLAFEVFSRSFFAEPSQLSAGELATMFHIYFLGSSEGLIFDVATANFDVSLGIHSDYLSERGVRFRLGAQVLRVDAAARKVLASRLIQ